MVVIKETGANLSGEYGKNFLHDIYDFSTVIGYSVEEEDGEVKVEFNPDRPDLFSFSALSNAIDVYNGRRTWKPLDFSPKEMDFIIEKSVRKLRPYTVGIQCRGPKIGNHFRDLIDFQERIHLSVGKDRSKVSIGIHDTRNIKQPIYYRAYKADRVSFTTYDGMVTGTAKDILEKHPKGKEYSGLIPGKFEVPIIEDANHQVMSLPPVINGNITTVTPESSEFFIDLTGTEVKALRDAFFLLSYFFRDLDYELLPSNLDDIREHMGFDGREIETDLSSINDLIGTAIPEDRLSELLRKMGYGSKPGKGKVTVVVPGNRIDVMGPADLIEDIAKAFGYQNIASQRPALNIVGREAAQKPFLNNVKGIMTGLGLQETMSYMVTTRRFYQGLPYYGDVHIRNPKSTDFSVVRDRLSFGVLDFLRINKRRSLPQNVFEIGEIVEHSRQYTHLCMAFSSSNAGYSDVKQVLDALLLRLGIRESRVEPENLDLLIDGRSGSIKISGKTIGTIGEVHPEILEAFELKNPVSLAELDLTSLYSILNDTS